MWSWCIGLVSSGTGPVTLNVGPVTLYTFPVTTILVGYRGVYYRYQLLFLHGSTCWLVRYTKIILQLEYFPHSRRGTTTFLNAPDWVISFELSYWLLGFSAMGQASRQSTNQIFASVYTKLCEPAPTFRDLIWNIYSGYRGSIQMVSRNQDDGPFVKMAEGTVI